MSDLAEKIKAKMGITPPATEIVKATCGHEVVWSPAQGLDERRRIKAQSCGMCQIDADIKKHPKKQPRIVPRLPHGATFHARYDAQEERWKGTLAIGAEESFYGEVSGVFGLMTCLDKQYRKWLKEEAKDAT